MLGSTDTPQIPPLTCTLQELFFLRLIPICMCDPYTKMVATPREALSLLLYTARGIPGTVISSPANTIGKASNIYTTLNVIGCGTFGDARPGHVSKTVLSCSICPFLIS